MYSFLNLLKESANSSVKIIKINDPHALVRPPQNVTLSTEKIKKLGIKTTSLVDGLSTLKKQIT